MYHSWPRGIAQKIAFSWADSSLGLVPVIHFHDNVYMWEYHEIDVIRVDMALRSIQKLSLLPNPRDPLEC